MSEPLTKAQRKYRQAALVRVNKEITMKIQSDFAILLVKEGRAELNDHFQGLTYEYIPEKLRVPVVIYGYIEGIHGWDEDGSQEFSVCVESVVISDEGGK